MKEFSEPKISESGNDEETKKQELSPILATLKIIENESLESLKIRLEKKKKINRKEVKI